MIAEKKTVDIGTEKKGQTNPLKKSQPLGATLAALGVKGAMPLHHGSQGCTAFTKTFLTQHFREIVPMQTTALTDIAAILGEDKNLVEGIKNVIDKQSPSLVFVITTGITEVRGDDIAGSIKLFREKFPEYKDTEILFANTPDFDNDAYVGYIKAVLALVDLAEKTKKKSKTRVNVFPHMNMTAGDLDEIRFLIESFGLDPIFIPDLSDSLGGQADEFYSVAPGGVTVEEIKSAGEAVMSISIGHSMKQAAEKLKEKTNVPYAHFDSVIGIAETDRFIKLLMELSGKTPVTRIRKQRKVALDTLLDAHFYYGGKKCVAALEPDGLLGIVNFLKCEIGVELMAGITTVKADWFADNDKVIVGDLEDMEELGQGADIVIGSTNAVHTANRLKAPLLRMGIPTKDRIGLYNKTYCGYRGTAELAADIGNCLIEKQQAGNF